MIHGLQEHLAEETWQHQARVQEDKVTALATENNVPGADGRKDSVWNSNNGGMLDVLAVVGVKLPFAFKLLFDFLSN